MTEFRPRGDLVAAPPRRRFWLHPAVLWPTLLLAMLLVARLVTGSAADPFDAGSPKSSRSAAEAESGNWNDVVDTSRGGQGSAPGAAAPGTAPGRALIAGLNLQPRLVGGQLSGFVVRPDEAALLSGTRLRPGDVLLDVDGRPLDEARVAGLADEVGDFDDVEVRYERGGQERKTLLVFRQR